MKSGSVPLTCISVFLFTLCIVLQSTLYAEEVIVIEGAEIRGNQEQPRILYIIPWQRPLLREGLTVNSTELPGSDLLKPIYRDEFVRQVTYFESLGSSGAGETDLPKIK
jgi:hypothetical protein